MDLLGGDVRRERRQEAQAAVEHRVGHVLAHEPDRRRRTPARRGRRRPQRRRSRRPTDCQPPPPSPPMRGVQRDQGGRVVEQRLALEDGHDAPRQPDTPADRGRRDGVGRCDHGSDGEAPATSRGRAAARARALPTPAVVKATRPTESSRIGAPVGVEVDQAGLHGSGVQQRREQPEQHDLGLEQRRPARTAGRSRSPRPRSGRAARAGRAWSRCAATTMTVSDDPDQREDQVHVLIIAPASARAFPVGVVRVSRRVPGSPRPARAGCRGG